MKLLILGHKEHGKTTFAEILRDKYGFTFTDSSMEAAKIFIYDELKEKYGYKTFEECFIDRRNKRSEWYNLITDYNKDNRSRLAEQIISYNDMYVGMRDHDEIRVCKEKNLFNLIIGIYDPRKDFENKDSFNIDLFEECDFIIYNNNTIETLIRRTTNIFETILNNEKIYKEQTQ